MFELEKSFDWNIAKTTFKKEFGDDVYNAWISNIALVSATNFEIVMAVPTAFIRDWINREYFDGRYKFVNGEKIYVKKGIKQILKDICPTLMSFSIIVDKSAKKEEELQQQNNIKSISEEDNLYAVGTVLNNKYTFENFVVGESNRLAYEVANRIASDDIEGMDVNPFFMYGSVGLGKTHLCQAIAWKVKNTRPNKKIIYLTAEKFMFLFVQSLQKQDINEFKNRLRNIDVLIIDDIQFILGKDKTQKEFFYTFETLINDNKQIILACDRSPAHLEALDEKLKSRINGGLIVDIKEPDYELRRSIVENKVNTLQLDLQPNFIDYIAENITSNGRDIEGLLKRLKVNQNIMNIKITKNEIDNLLNDFVTKKIVNLDLIKEKVADYYDLTVFDLTSNKRNKNLVCARHVAMYLVRELTNKSYPEIARAFSGRNHATVIHAVTKIKKDIITDKDLALEVAKIKDVLL